MINTVAVIGGSGFLGRATVEKLARAGKRVIVLCRNAERAKYLKPMGDVGQITIIAGNAMNAQTLDDVIASADAVVNLVGILAEGGGQRLDDSALDPMADKWTNASSPCRVAAAPINPGSSPCNLSKR